MSRALGRLLTRAVLSPYSCEVLGIHAVSHDESNALNKADHACRSACRFSLLPAKRDVYCRSFTTTRALKQIQQFRLAQTGEGIKECELVQWFVKEGDTVEEFDRICEVQSDKASIEITSPFKGIVAKLYHEPGEIVPVGELLADIQAGAVEKDEQQQSTSSEPPERTTGNVASDENPYKVQASPAARRLARELGVDLNTVHHGSNNGKITTGDILQSRQGQASELNTKTDQLSSKLAPELFPLNDSRATSAPNDEIIQLKGYRRAMVQSMQRASQVPHFHFCDEVQMDALVQLREQLNRSTSAAQGLRLSYMPFIIKAAASALHHHPMINASMMENGTSVKKHGAINIGIAVATPSGLAVPNIKNIECVSDLGSLVLCLAKMQKKSILEIASELKELQKAASANQLTPESLKGGTFTISNIGSVGGTYATPLVNPPEVAIMALGKVRCVPYVNNSGNIVPAHVMNISLGADHRVVDGAMLAQFASSIKVRIENPAGMLLQTH